MKKETAAVQRSTKEKLQQRMASAAYWFEFVKKWMWMTVRFVLIFGISFVIVYPILLKLSIAFKSMDDLYDSTVIWVPHTMTLDNFKLVFKAMNYPHVLLNTLLLSSAVMLLQTVTCVLAGYGFARVKFRGSGFLFAGVIFTILVPAQTIMVPLYLQFKNFDLFGLIELIEGEPANLINTYWPFIISAALGMGVKTGLYVYIFRQFFKGIPREIEEAAYVDGAGYFTTFTRVILPNAVPSMVTVMLFSFVWQWNDSFFTNMYLNEPKVMSSMMASSGYAIATFLSGGGQAETASYVQDPFFMSMMMNTSVLMSILPLIILYLFVQRHFVESVERSGLVG
ncbi:multiple sugar transport system permease protein [Paenibacillus algorifonticola]|uniref:Multiple sugar transport system permease protein n=1 Tax=Paenibacillus algorifonticola TaxID=684063 RepID=A0A1I2IF72_9BACL|nr:carbohydrate ABC transporter permease [Paenibacillus algorifonticola]SFF40989.1 multiple sugar transport system permease protein [Paenibacillus algorifonticola]